MNIEPPPPVEISQEIEIQINGHATESPFVCAFNFKRICKFFTVSGLQICGTLIYVKNANFDSTQTNFGVLPKFRKISALL